MTKEEYSKMYAYDKLMEHLEIAIKDPRKREKIRASIAKSHMISWYEEGKNDFERRSSTKNL